MQEDVGLQAATDGEFRRASWHMDFIYQLGGIGKSDDKLRVEMRNEKEEIAFETAALRSTTGSLSVSRSSRTTSRS